MPINKEMCRETHIDIACSVAVCILKHHAEGIGHDTKIKRVLSDVRLDLDLVIHRHSKKDYVLASVVLGNAVELRDLAVADLAAGGPKRKHYHLPLKLIEAVRLSVKALADKIGGRLSRFEALLREGRYGENQAKK
jgi:hypothetical protein